MKKMDVKSKAKKTVFCKEHGNNSSVLCTRLINIHLEQGYFYLSLRSTIVFAFDSGSATMADMFVGVQERVPHTLQPL